MSSSASRSLSTVCVTVGAMVRPGLPMPIDLAAPGRVANRGGRLGTPYAIRPVCLGCIHSTKRVGCARRHRTFVKQPLQPVSSRNGLAASAAQSPAKGRPPDGEGAGCMPVARPRQET